MDCTWKTTSIHNKQAADQSIRVVSNEWKARERVESIVQFQKICPTVAKKRNRFQERTWPRISRHLMEVPLKLDPHSFTALVYIVCEIPPCPYVKGTCKTIRE